MRVSAIFKSAFFLIAIATAASVCNGPKCPNLPGPRGFPGATGAAGPTGMDGPTGSPGPQGTSACLNASETAWKVTQNESVTLSTLDIVIVPGLISTFEITGATANLYVSSMGQLQYDADLTMFMFIDGFANQFATRLFTIRGPTASYRRQEPWNLNLVLQLSPGSHTIDIRGKNDLLGVPAPVLTNGVLNFLLLNNCP